MAADPKQIAMIEGLLERVKNGDVQSFGYVALEEDDSTTVAWQGVETVRLRLLGALSLLSRRIQDSIILKDEGEPTHGPH